MEKTRLKGNDEKTTANKVGKAILLVIQIVIGCFVFLLGSFLLLFDGFCAGGRFCTRPPGVVAFLGAILIALSISQFFLTARRFKEKWKFILLVTLIAATFLYCVRLLLYFN